MDFSISLYQKNLENTRNGGYFDTMKLQNGYGTISKSKEKRRKPWRVRVTIGWDENGKQLFKNLGYFTTQAEGLKQLELYHTNPLLIDNKTVTFKEIYDIWSKEKFKKIADSSIDGYVNAYNYCEELWDIPFEQIKLKALQDIVNKADGKYATQKKIKGLLGLLYDYGIANDIVLKKYSDYIILGEKKEKTIKITFSEEEIDILWDNVNLIPFVDTVLILIYTGMRPSELLKMKREKVFLDKDYMIGGSKTEAGINRIIPIHPRIKPLIEKWYYNSTSEYLIYNNVNKKICYQNYIGRNWANVVEALNLNHNPYDCRHTFATRMDDAGANKLCIKLIMGHQIKDVTDKVYTHKKIEQLIEAVNLLR